MSRRWISLTLAFCLLLPMMNVSADEEHDNWHQIGVQSGSFSDVYAAENLPNAEVSGYDTIDIAVEALKQGDIDFVLGDLPTLRFYEDDDENLDVVDTFAHEELGIGVAPGESDLLAAIDVALGEIIDSGEYDEIFAATFGDEIIVLTDDTTEYTATEYPADPAGKLADVLDAGTIEFGADPYYPPFESYDDDGNWVGFDVDMAAAIGAKIAAAYDQSLNVTMQEKTWDDLLAFAYDDYDATLTAMTKTEQRAENTDFSRSYYSSAQGVLATADSPTITGVDDLNDFVCDNGETIPMDWVNDGYDDCGDGSDEDESDEFVCDNGNTISYDWYDDGWDDCGDGSDEPNGVDSGDDGEDDLGFGLPTGQLGLLINPEGDGANQELYVNFITPHMAEIEVTSSLSLDADTSNTLREDIILASILGEVDSYFAEGKIAINAAYDAGEADGEETILAYMSLYENATLSAVPDYTVDDNETSFDFVFNTAEDIGPFVEFDDVIITQQHLDTYYEIAWGDGMNNILAMDLTLTFVVFLGFIAAFSGEEIDEDELNATFESLLLGSMTTCPEAPNGFAVMGCVMEKFSQASVELIGDSEMSMVDDYDEEDIVAYCFDNANLILTDADTTIDGGNCIDSVEVFYNMSEDEGGPSMDGVATVNGVGLSDQPGGFPLFWPEVTMSIVDTESVLGQFSDNVDKNTTVMSEMKFTAFFPGVSAGDSHTFMIEPEDDEFFANVSTLMVSPPSGYAFGEGSAGDVVILTGSEEAMTWTFTKSGDITEEVDDSGLPGPGLLVVLLTIFGVASVRRRF